MGVQSLKCQLTLLLINLRYLLLSVDLFLVSPTPAVCHTWIEKPGFEILNARFDNIQYARAIKLIKIKWKSAFRG